MQLKHCPNLQFLGGEWENDATTYPIHSIASQNTLLELEPGKDSFALEHSEVRFLKGGSKKYQNQVAVGNICERLVSSHSHKLDHTHTPLVFDTKYTVEEGSTPQSG